MWWTRGRGGTPGSGEQKDQSSWLQCEGRGEVSDGSRGRCGLQARLDPGAHIVTLSSPHAPSLTVPFSVLTQLPGGLSPAAKIVFMVPAQQPQSEGSFHFQALGRVLGWTDLSHVPPCTVTVTFPFSSCIPGSPFGAGAGCCLPLPTP